MGGPLIEIMSSGSFLVIDTEGKPLLQEIAVFDHSGKLVYEALAEEDTTQGALRLNRKPLVRVLQEFKEIANNQILIGHFAEHDRRVLLNSYRKAQISPPTITFRCTCELARKCYPNIPSYSLQFLCRHLQIKVRGRIFDTRQHHRARYDAEFTYELYIQLSAHQIMTNRLKSTRNPFGSNRVDNPFQDHIDLKTVYHTEYEILKAVITDIKEDPNQQSRGAVVIGEPGAGKTHLMMRLAKEVLATNRLLFIRQPNNSAAVLTHSYSRMLESFAEKIPHTGFTQFERLISNSFVRILEQMPNVGRTERGTEILNILRENSLALFRVTSAQKRLAVWEYIERNITRWWGEQNFAAGYSKDILQGIIRFCYYTDQNRKAKVRRWLAAGGLSEEDAQDIGLTDWQEDMSKEEFSLEGIKTFGKLSTLDEPLIVVYDQLEGLADKKDLLTNFGGAVKEILTHVPNTFVILNLFPERWQQYRDVFDAGVVDRVSQHEIHLQIPSQEQLQEILDQKAKSVDLNLEEMFTSGELQDILAQPSIRTVLNRAAAYFRLKSKNISLPPTGARKEEILDSSQENRLQKLEKEVTTLNQTLAKLSAQVEFLLNGQTVESPAVASPLSASIEEDNLAISDEKDLEDLKLDELSPLEALLPDSGQLIEDFLIEREKQLEKEYEGYPIITDTDELGKLFEIVNAFQVINKKIAVDQLSVGKKVLPEHLKVDADRGSYVVGFLNATGNAFQSRIKNINQLLSSHRLTYFRISRDKREPTIKGPASIREIRKLDESSNGAFVIMEKKERIQFEMAYSLIVAIQNRDLDVEMSVGLRELMKRISEFWLIQFLSPSSTES